MQGIFGKTVSNFPKDDPEGKPVYCKDFLYDRDFSIQEFLLRKKEKMSS